jgi:hypothetical protein
MHASVVKQRLPRGRRIGIKKFTNEHPPPTNMANSNHSNDTPRIENFWSWWSACTRAQMMTPMSRAHKRWSPRCTQCPSALSATTHSSPHTPHTSAPRTTYRAVKRAALVHVISEGKEVRQRKADKHHQRCRSEVEQVDAGNCQHLEQERLYMCVKCGCECMYA